MAEHLEIELKWALDVAGHTALAPALERLLGAPHRLRQDNRFFDTKDRRLRKAALNLRLRRENDRLLMTCKGRGGIGAAGEHRHTEWEEWLDPALWQNIEAGTLSAAQLPLPEPILHALGDGHLLPLGGFANQRLEFHQRESPAALLCLDRTEYIGARIDYELEIETADPAANALRWGDYLKQWNIAFSPQPLTKFARFLTLAESGLTPR
jgi:uncharacterized protein YjbK